MQARVLESRALRKEFRSKRGGVTEMENAFHAAQTTSVCCMKLFQIAVLTHL